MPGLRPSPCPDPGPADGDIWRYGPGTLRACGSAPERRLGEEAHFAAFCLGAQQGAGAQWQFWDDFYRAQRRWFAEGTAFTDELAARAGVDANQYAHCLATQAADSVYALQAIAETELLPDRWATPAFRIEDSRGRWLNSLSGSPSLEAWFQELDRHLG